MPQVVPVVNFPPKFRITPVGNSFDFSKDEDVMRHLSHQIETLIVERRIKLPEIDDIDDSIDYDYLRISDITN